jgi:hypothetical protein
MRDRNKVPVNWRRIGEGDRMVAVRDDGVEVVRDPTYSNAPYVIINMAGRAYSQIGRGGLERPRLYRYLDAATAAADRVWPMAFDHETAFHLVADKNDWRAPIDKVVPAEKLVAVIKAICFYTGTETTVTVEKDNRFRVKSVGYRMGPAGP